MLVYEAIDLLLAAARAFFAVPLVVFVRNIDHILLLNAFARHRNSNGFYSNLVW